MSRPSSPFNVLALSHLENLWEQTQNPLYAWDAIRVCDDEGVWYPEWVCGYLADGARKIGVLGDGRDFRRPDVSLTPKAAKAKVGEALGLHRRGAKNAFSRRAEDLKAMRAAQDMQQASTAAGREQIKQRVMAEHSVEPDRAARIIGRGRRLSRRKELIRVPPDRETDDQAFPDCPSDPPKAPVLYEWAGGRLRIAEHFTMRTWKAGK